MFSPGRIVLTSFEKGSKLKNSSLHKHNASDLPGAWLEKRREEAQIETRNIKNIENSRSAFKNKLSLKIESLSGTRNSLAKDKLSSLLYSSTANNKGNSRSKVFNA